MHLPCLATDEGSSGNTNEKTKDVEPCSTVDETSAAHWNCSTTQHSTEKDTGTIFVTTRTKDETHKDGSTDTDNVRSPEILLREVNGFLDFGQERGNGEPNEERNEESKPGAVESSHVRALEAEHPNLSGSIILVGVNIDVVGIVLLPLLRLSERVNSY